MENLTKYWDEGLSYEQFLKVNEEIIDHFEKDAELDSKNFLEYYKLAKVKMDRLNKSYFPQSELIEKLASKNFKGNLLIISEGWCGDGSMIVPVIYHFFKGKNEVRINLRDQNDLIEHFLTNGGRSIPIVLILDENNNVANRWGPRPKHGAELLKKHKENPDQYTKEQFHNELQVYYTKNKGKDIIEEILDLI